MPDSLKQFARPLAVYVALLVVGTVVLAVISEGANLDIAPSRLAVQIMALTMALNMIVGVTTLSILPSLSTGKTDEGASLVLAVSSAIGIALLIFYTYVSNNNLLHALILANFVVNIGLFIILVINASKATNNIIVNR